MTKPVITSLLDTDMYKITMHAAVFTNFPEAKVTYKYTNRTSQMYFNKASIDWLSEQFDLLGKLKFTAEEIDYLTKEISFLPKAYLNYISSDEFQLKPQEQFNFSYEKLENEDDRYNLILTIHGLWKDTILYEIPVLALVSEAYFKFVDTDWDCEGQIEKAQKKAELLLSNGLIFSEFGTRRRRSFEAQDMVMKGLINAVNENPQKYKKLFVGSSNILFSKTYNVKPIGTVAHEWIMGIASITNDYINANKNSMDYWIKTFGKDNAGLALSDTFGTDNFLKAFKPPYSDAYAGIRQDSGDPAEYTKKVANHYINVLKMPKFTKSICYSDSLNVEKAIKYAQVAKECGMNCNFGIGTYLTNDFQKKSNSTIKSEPLNIVIKLLDVNGNPAIKISDNLGKNMGDPETVQKVKEELGYVERSWTGDNEAHRWAA
ncbi:hypothetical protein TBLA_0B04130 [Henningerozyma blattae CBS 6284]|uniref:Nicotinate phosphoribosyltransferase n=1 Tax=Henningerozyma blattae (strain ATCC 34711 / CBS 6284 / DSM 70876 / NBRC 10599 / NRRL Y-10934 / UCD 77-7) TaxID=1071380 RepID=I2GYP9_HENB6|nr:hypothetical protein TBLA_0B04130 [Tetrapisispora blattae CBS 6284]CCH59251.1 hypothetical protein TBLA_0B04130 [Tetrapisispora blattae CBS 6284]